MKTNFYQSLNLKLINLNHVQGEKIKSTPVSVEYHYSHFFSINSLKNYDVQEAYSSNDSLIIIRANPKNTETIYSNRTYYINKSDTTICAINIQTVDSLQFRQPIIEYDTFRARTKKSFTHIEFKELNGYFYMSEASGICHLIYYPTDDKNGISISSYANIEAIGIDEKKYNGKKLNGSSMELFTIDSTTDQDFWSTRHF